MKIFVTLLILILSINIYGQRRVDTLRQATPYLYFTQKDESVVKLYMKEGRVILFDASMSGLCRVSIGRYTLSGGKVDIVRDTTDDLCLLEEANDSVMNNWKYYVFSDFSDCDFEIMNGGDVRMNSYNVKDGLIRNKELRESFELHRQTGSITAVSHIESKDSLITFPYRCGHLFTYSATAHRITICFQVDDMAICYENLVESTQPDKFIRKGDKVGIADNKTVIETFIYYDR